MVASESLDSENASIYEERWLEDQPDTDISREKEEYNRSDPQGQLHIDHNASTVSSSNTTNNPSDSKPQSNSEANRSRTYIPRANDARIGFDEQIEKPNGSSDVTEHLSMAPNLSLDTRRAMTEPSRSIGDHRGSLGVDKSPVSPGQGPSRTLPLNSPTSPRTRDRGFSLRRSLLARNAHENLQRTGSILELQPSANTTRNDMSTLVENRTQPDKKPETNITVSPISDDVYQNPKPTKEPRPPLSLPHYETWIKTRAARSKLFARLGDLYVNLRKKVLHIHEIQTSKFGRQLQLDIFRKKPLIDERTGRGYIDNIIRSSKYTVWNFLPRQLFAQFSKLANFYFLCVSILQMIPGLSTTGNYTTIVPLTFFVTLSIVKEGYDDFRRYRLDKAENNKITSVLRADKSARESFRERNETTLTESIMKRWTDTKWKDVQVGDVVRLQRNEAAPADLVILNSKGVNGIAFLETMALDGETNLKSKQASPPLAKHCTNFDDISQCEAHFVVEDPNLDLYSFEGKCTFANETLPLTNNEIVYRGSILRNTPELYGMVIYSGEECKIRMNATKNPRIKAPALQAVVNKVVVIIVLFVLALAIFNTAAYQIWGATTEEKAWYLVNASVAFFPILTSFIILFNTMIPLSLYVSLEIVKLFQLSLMKDIDMYDEDSNTPMEARTSTINEELGQVSYIFSDKTGTLTNNSMKFRKLSVAGAAWLHDPDIQEEAIRAFVRRSMSHKAQGKGKKPLKSKKSLSIRHPTRHNSDASVPLPLSASSPVGRNSSVSSRWKSPKSTGAQAELRTAELLQYIHDKPDTVFARKVRMFLISMALCHTCIPERNDDGEISYQSASPDEQALVQAAQELGYMLIDRQNGTITIKSSASGFTDEATFEIYQILDVIEFSSNRKRMSIIVRMPDDRICVFCKGADSIITQRLRLSNLALDKAIMIERRVSERKSLEAQEAIRRNSEHQNRKISITRTSLSMNRHSIGGIPRPSIATKRLQPIQDEFDNWLRDRQTDVTLSPQDGESINHSPRDSVHSKDPSSKNPSNNGRMSFQGDDGNEIVEEAILMSDAAVFERCFQHINDFATEGLRTLLYGYRYLEDEEYKTWKKIYLDASTSLDNRQEMIERAGNLIETNFELAGATAIEDKLQEGVPDAIDKLRRAKIKMWMLTGDKRETAINIGHSCRLIKDYSSITVLDHEAGDVNHRIAAAFVEINRGQVAHSVVVIDGQTLGIIEANDTLRKLFIDLAILVDSVICCRASPSQKAYLVGAIRKKVKKAVTLAIGDGANDIAMIQEAHVGIGITGKEGLQAARTSDYSIAQFRFLLKLLLVHGRWNYIRTCKYTLGTFWKEMFFYLTQALYQRYVGYTGTSLYESWSLSMFNTLFTSLPVIFMGIFEKDLAASTLLAIPELYAFGHRNGGFNLLIFAFWVFMASADAMIVFFMMIGIYGRPLSTPDNDLYTLGSLTFTACIVIIATKIQFLELHNKSITCAIAMFLSVGAWFLWNLILSALYTDNKIYDVRDGLLRRFGRNGLWWLTVILIISAVWVFEIAIKALRVAWAPDDVDVFQELQKDECIRKRLEAAAGLETGLDSEMEEDRAIAKRTAEEDERREDDVRELLERPRVIMNENGPATMRRRQPSGSGDWGLEHESSERLVTFASREQGDARYEESDDDDDDDDGKAKKSGPLHRRSVDVQEMLRRGFGSVRRSLDVGIGGRRG